MCFAPQRRALFRHLKFQEWSEHGGFCTVWLGNVFRATTARNCSSLIWPAGSAPAALASLLFDPLEPQIIGKTQCFATFLPFRAPGSSFFWDFLFSDLLSSALLFSILLLHLCFSSVHIVGITSKLPSIINGWFRVPLWLRKPLNGGPTLFVVLSSYSWLAPSHVNQRRTSFSGSFSCFRRVRRICFASSPASQKSMIKHTIPSLVYIIEMYWIPWNTGKTRVTQQIQQIHDIKLTNELRGKCRNSFECGDIEFLSEGLWVPLPNEISVSLAWKRI